MMPGIGREIATKEASGRRRHDFAIFSPGFFLRHGTRAPDRPAILDQPRKESTMSRPKVFADPRLFWALGGPLLLGALPGLRFGLGPTLRLGPSFVAALLATAAVMGPALYLIWGLTGARGSLGQVGNAFMDALAAAGRVHVGFAPAVLMMSATVAYRDHAILFALAGYGGGLLLGASRLWRALRPGASGRHAAAVLVPWLAAAILMGGRLVIQFVMPVVTGGKVG